MRQVQLHEAEQNLAALVAEAEAGESLTILRNGKPVAQIIPFDGHAEEKEVTETDRQAAAKRLQALMDQGFDLGIEWNGRDEIYDRETAIRELKRLLEQGLDLGGTPPTRDEMHDGR